MRGYWINSTIGAAQTAALLAEGETVYEPTNALVAGASTLYGSSIQIDNVRVNDGTDKPIVRAGYNLVGTYSGWDILTKDIELKNNIGAGIVPMPQYQRIPEVNGLKTLVSPVNEDTGSNPLLWKKAAKLIIAEPSENPAVPWESRSALLQFLQGAKNAYLAAREETDVFGIPDFPQNVVNESYGGGGFGYVTMKQNTKYVGIGRQGGGGGSGTKINSPFDFRPYLCKYRVTSGTNQPYPASIALNGYEEGMLSSPLDNITCVYPGCLRSRAVAHNANEKINHYYNWNNNLIDANYQSVGRFIPCGENYNRCNRQFTMNADIQENKAIRFYFSGSYRYKLWLSTLEVDTYGNGYNAMGNDWFGYYSEVDTFPYVYPISPNLVQGTKAYKGDGLGSLDSPVIDNYITPWYTFNTKDPLRYCYMINNWACCWVLIYHTGDSVTNESAAANIAGNVEFLIV